MEIKKIEDLKDFILGQIEIAYIKVFLEKQPLGYTNENIKELQKRIEIENYLNEKMRVMMDFMDNKNINEFERDLNDYTETNKITYDEQRKICKELLGLEYTLEEYITMF